MQLGAILWCFYYNPQPPSNSPFILCATRWLYLELEDWIGSRPTGCSTSSVSGQSHKACWIHQSHKACWKSILWLILHQFDMAKEMEVCYLDPATQGGVNNQLLKFYFILFALSFCLADQDYLIQFCPIQNVRTERRNWLYGRCLNHRATNQTGWKETRNINLWLLRWMQELVLVSENYFPAKMSGGPCSQRKQTCKP